MTVVGQYFLCGRNFNRTAIRRDGLITSLERGADGAHVQYVQPADVLAVLADASIRSDKVRPCSVDIDRTVASVFS